MLSGLCERECWDAIPEMGAIMVVSFREAIVVFNQFWSKLNICIAVREGASYKEKPVR